MSQSASQCSRRKRRGSARLGLLASRVRVACLSCVSHLAAWNWQRSDPPAERLGVSGVFGSV